MGIRTGMSLLLGAVINYWILAPWAMEQGLIEGTGFRAILKWAAQTRGWRCDPGPLTDRLWTVAATPCCAATGPAAARPATSDAASPLMVRPARPARETPGSSG